MKKIAMLLLLMLCLPVSGFGAQIYGNLRAKNASVGEGVLVRIQCGTDNPYDARTDIYGSYSVQLPLRNQCQLSVYYANQWSQRVEVYPYEDPVRYDFDLVEQQNGPILKRR